MPLIISSRVPLRSSDWGLECKTSGFLKLDITAISSISTAEQWSLPSPLKQMLSHASSKISSLITWLSTGIVEQAKFSIQLFPTNHRNLTLKKKYRKVKRLIIVMVQRKKDLDI